MGARSCTGPSDFTCFQFPYDWRRDNAENARRLHEFIREKRDYVQAELLRRYGIRRDDLRFDVIAHSMGGLLLRYYLEYGDQPLPEDGSAPRVTWAGAVNVAHAVLVATPTPARPGAREPGRGRALLLGAAHAHRSRR